MNYNIELKGCNEWNEPIVSINNSIVGTIEEYQKTNQFVIHHIKENSDGNYTIPNAIFYKKKLYKSRFIYDRPVIFGSNKKINNINVDIIEPLINSIFIYNKCLYDNNGKAISLMILPDNYNKQSLELYPYTTNIHYDFCIENNSIECLIAHRPLYFFSWLYQLYKLNKIIIGNKVVYKNNNKWKLEQNLF